MHILLPRFRELSIFSATSRLFSAPPSLFLFRWLRSKHNYMLLISQSGWAWLVCWHGLNSFGRYFALKLCLRSKDEYFKINLDFIFLQHKTPKMKVWCRIMLFLIVKVILCSLISWLHKTQTLAAARRTRKAQDAASYSTRYVTGLGSCPEH